MLVAAIDDDDELVRYLGTQEDVTERKERKRKLRAEQRLTDSDYCESLPPRVERIGLREPKQPCSGCCAENYRNNHYEQALDTLDDLFYVSDSGCGIPGRERDEVFKPGYSTTEEGTGFGLRIVDQIADAHGWAIPVTESEQGGARFEITGVET